MGKDLEEKLERMISSAISEKVFPGCSLGVVLKRGAKKVWSFGNFTYDSLSQVVTENTIYDVASITKVIPTASLALKFLEEKKVTLKTKLIEYVPEYVGSYQEEITISHLLNQTLVFPFSLSQFQNESAKQILDVIFHAKLRYKPGEQYCYTNTSSLLLGLLLERVSGKKLDVLADDYFFKPLAMQNTTFHPEKLVIRSIIPTEIDESGFEVRGIVHDESARVFAKEGRVVGSAGLFSTAADLLIFLKVLLDNGTSHKEKYFSEQTLSFMAQGIGWQIGQQWMGKHVPVNVFGKTGFTGCFVFADPVNRIGIVMLSNHTYPKRTQDRGKLNNVRSEVIDAIYKHI